MKDTFTPVLTALADNDSPLARHTHTTLSAAMHGKPHGTMRAWMESHHGHAVTTVQVDTRTGSVWAPTGRTIDASRATYATLNGSRRDYTGMTVLSASPGALIVSDDWHTIAYIIEPDFHA